MTVQKTHSNNSSKSSFLSAVQRKWIALGLLIFGALYLLLCTFLWNVVYGFFFVWVTNNAPNAEAAASSWCKPGDWVLETFQPMVSDQRMIDHFSRNKEAMTRVAEMAARGKAADNIGETAEFKALERETDLEVGSAHNWAEQPYSLENAQASRSCWVKAVSQKDRDACWSNDVNLGRGIFNVVLTPKFGKTHAQYFCSTERNSFKHFYYYSGGIPRVEEGHILWLVQYSERYNTYLTEKDYKLVPSTDVDPGGDAPIARQLDERWFITRN